MKKFFLFTFVIIVLCSCSTKAVTKEETIPFETQVTEEITYTSNTLQKDCYLCGGGKSLMPYYAQFDSIGIICLNTWNIIDSRIRTFDDHGNPVKTSGSQTSMLNCGNDECHFGASTSSNRIRADLNVTFGENSLIKPEKLCDELCQTCLDMVIENCTSPYKPTEVIRDAVLVDFQEKKTYSITNNSGFYIRDYLIHIDQKDNEYSIFVVHCPSTEA